MKRMDAERRKSPEAAVPGGARIYVIPEKNQLDLDFVRRFVEDNKSGNPQLCRDLLRYYCEQNNISFPGDELRQ